MKKKHKLKNPAGLRLGFLEVYIDFDFDRKDDFFWQRLKKNRSKQIVKRDWLIIGTG